MLESLCLMPPKLGQVRRGISPAATTMLVSRKAGDAVVLPMPLFWDQAPWDTWAPVIAQGVFSAMQSRGVIVSALQSELGLYPQKDPDAEKQVDAADEQAASMSDAHEGIPRMLPYRNERYGLNNDDFDQCMVIDMQLSAPRDFSGRFAYSAALLGRWEGTPEEQPLSGGGWIPAMTLPPDVVDADHLSAKVAQLRMLAPQAAIVASVTPEWLDDSLPVLMKASPDAMLIRLGQLRMAGLDLAHFVRRLLARVDSISHLPIWLTPPRTLRTKSNMTVSDSVKILALGVSAVAVDCWMEEIIEEIDEITPPSSYAVNPGQQVAAEVEEIVQRLFDPKLELFSGLYSTLVHDRPAELLGTFDPDIANLLELPCLGRL